MRTYLLSILSFFITGFIHAQTTVNGAFIHGGITRTYAFYVPASYSPGNAVPLVIGLHGLSSSGAEFAQYRDFRPIADTANFIMVHPDGSMMLGVRFWNYGNILGSTVDDVGFLEALIDTISAHYTVNPQRVYCAGMSNGSFMSYLLACASDRFAAVAGVTGSMSVTMYNNCNPGHPTPVIHIHGTDDNTNPYNGTSTMTGIESMVRFWVDQNQCDTNPVVNPVPNINTNDNATATQYVYSGGTNGHSVELFKVTGGGHSWPGSPMPGSSETTCMDFEACKEIWRFFSQYQLGPPNSVDAYSMVELHIWPNPVQDYLYIRSENHIVTDVTIMDIQGRLVLQQSAQNILSVDLSGLKAGNYIAKISGQDFEVVRKVVVR